VEHTKEENEEGRNVSIIFCREKTNTIRVLLFQVLTLRMLVVRKLRSVSVSAIVSRMSRQVESTVGAKRPGFDDDDDDDDELCDESASSLAFWDASPDESPEDDDDERPCA